MKVYICDYCGKQMNSGVTGCYEEIIRADNVDEIVLHFCEECRDEAISFVSEYINNIKKKISKRGKNS